MNMSRNLRWLLLATLGLCASAGAAERLVDHATMQRLSSLHRGEALSLDAFPIGPDHNATLRFERVQIYANDAPLYVIAGAEKRQLPRSTRIFLRARSDDGSVRVAMSLNADGSFAEGNGYGPDGSFAVAAHADASGGHAFSVRTLESTLPSPDAFEFKCGNETINLNLHSLTHAPDLATQLRNATSGSATATANAVVPVGGTPQATQSFRTAVIAIDTDSLFMSRLFSNNTTTATNWIASMFNTMNTMYEADLNVQLLIGTTILRTSAGSDPYTGLAQNQSSNGADLNLFGNYWRLNESAVPRSFAILLSGAIASSGSGCSAAGIAWIDEYCDKGFVAGSDIVGSYSVNKVCSTLSIDPNGTFDARIVGHEIGHNFGANHTHCTNLSTGAAPTGSNTIDQCYNGESASGCYAGPTSCAAGGSGTIMSYCNISGCGTQNQLHFHPTHINNVLLPAIAANTPSCLASGNDIIFQDKFGG